MFKRFTVWLRRREVTRLTKAILPTILSTWKFEESLRYDDPGHLARQIANKVVVRAHNEDVGNVSYF